MPALTAKTGPDPKRGVALMVLAPSRWPMVAAVQVVKWFLVGLSILIFPLVIAAVQMFEFLMLLPIYLFVMGIPVGLCAAFTKGWSAISRKRKRGLSIELQRAQGAESDDRYRVAPYPATYTVRYLGTPIEQGSLEAGTLSIRTSYLAWPGPEGQPLSITTLALKSKHARAPRRWFSFSGRFKKGYYILPESKGVGAAFVTERAKELSEALGIPASDIPHEVEYADEETRARVQAKIDEGDLKAIVHPIKAPAA